MTIIQVCLYLFFVIYFCVAKLYQLLYNSGYKKAGNMKLYTLLIVFVYLIPCVSFASVSCYELGGTTYCNGTDSDGNSIHTSSYELNNP